MVEDYITVKIGSMYYRVTADDDPEYVRSIAKTANEMLSDLKEKHRGLSDAAAAVLALLNALDQVAKLKSNDSAVYRQKADVEKSLEESLAEQLRLRENLWEVKKDLIYYRNLCDMYEERLSSIPQNLPKTPRTKSNETPRPLDKMQTTFADMEVYENDSTENTY